MRLLFDLVRSFDNRSRASLDRLRVRQERFRLRLNRVRLLRLVVARFLEPRRLRVELLVLLFYWFPFFR